MPGSGCKEVHIWDRDTRSYLSSRPKVSAAHHVKRFPVLLVALTLYKIVSYNGYQLIVGRPDDGDDDDKDLGEENLEVGRISSVSENGGTQGSVGEVIEFRPKRNWKSYLWDTWDKSPEERRFLTKLDTVILTFASLGYFIKSIDQVNIYNAFVSGMKEDLGMWGNELNYMQTCWTIGYVIGEIPRYEKHRLYDVSI